MDIVIFCRPNHWRHSLPAAIFTILFSLFPVGNVYTDLMPGPNDPATVAVPQQALHRVMFRRAGLLPTLACVTNPYSCSLAGRSVLSVSGQTIADILRNSTIEVS